ncbi:hypothetical protein JTB14_035344 [Gonioctena quinquepunctata]|nr:hypothetical protein JTB14_035344 [Gonioctena quinquepunctata]
MPKDHHKIDIRSAISNNEETITHPQDPEWKIKRANWEIYSDYIDQHLTDCIFSSDINETVESFTDLITSAAHIAVGGALPEAAPTTESESSLGSDEFGWKYGSDPYSPSLLKGSL